MKVSRKYKEIFKLKKMLEDAKIPFDFFSMQDDIEPGIKDIAPDFEHWHICYPAKDDKCIISAIEGFGTYGERDDKIEIMGGLTKEEAEDREVIGYLTAEEVFDRIKKDYMGGIKLKKVIRYVDEDTLEIMEKVVETDIPENEVDNIVAMFEQALDCNSEEFTEKYRAYKEAEKEFNKLYEPFKTNLIKLHEDHPEIPKSVVIGNTKLTYVSPSTRNSIDSKKLKEEEPTVAEKYTKTTNVKASIRLEEIF